ncbi:hypothetical protein [Microseira wollei]|uniref:Uncharacterized protein n=1 Tax=Microseira wollei NIES-4236 TaxID=2530354 RepID=A0AAV3XEN3_9CYAN|nr:hypothetical protein [Microseira wollei]GET39886.1 hypothetical protein MiSe_46580 [Microseira wollei NIES-4236]
MKTHHISILFLTSLSAIAITTNLAFISKVDARPCGSGWLDRLGCTLDPTNPRDNGSMLASRFSVYVKNNTQQRIIVTARYMNYFESRRGQSCSTVDGGGANCDDITNWVTYSWDFSPGESALLINDAVGRNIYLSARAVDGSSLWPEKEVDMGSHYGRFYYSFNP